MGREPRDPAEKKRLSYERDQRYAYGNNDKAARKAVPRNRRLRASAERKHVRDSLAPGSLPERIDAGDHLDVELLPTAKRGWRKAPGRTLGEHLDWQRRWRKR